MSRDRIDTSIRFALRKIDFGKYAGVVKSMLGDAAAVVVCDARGRRVWSLAKAAPDVFIEPLNRLNEAVPTWPQTGVAIRRCTVDAERSVYVTSICDEDKQPMAGLFVLVQHRAGGAAIEYKQLSNGVHSLARMLGDEIQLLAELVSMTEELSQRYEELNLIYNTEDNIKYFDEGQDAIRKLVRNTSEYLDASFAAVVMAANTGLTMHVNPKRPLERVDELRSVVCGELFDHLAFRKEVLVHTGGRRYRELLGDIECQLLACPIFDENRDVIGAIFLANPPDADGFASSDRKLLQVMAHKASRIIQANYDSLTGMMTRNGFEYHLETGLYVVRYRQVAHSVLNLNVDRLHVVNDTSGHHAGDELIRDVARVVRQQLGEKDVVARIGGGEFGVMLVGNSADEGEEVAERIRSAVQQLEFVRDGRRFQVSVSIGLAPMESGSESVLAVLSAAEVACAAAKDLGRNRVQIFQTDNTMLVRRKAQIHWLGKLHSALREDRFALYCQPIQAADRADTRWHAEILLRLEDEEQGILAPAVFLGSAERYNLMPAIDRWVIRHTLKMLASNLPRKMLASQTWSINLSGQTLSDGNFMQFIIDETRRSGIDPGCLCFEITETAAVANLREAGQFMTDLRKLGFKFSLDDFGSGLSSFAYLRSLPVDYLKIDGAIAREVVRDRIAASMVGAITSIGRDMELKTIAEFVESDAVQTRLAELGVHYMQGYSIGKPRPLREQLVDMTAQMNCSGDTIRAAALIAPDAADDASSDEDAMPLQANL